MKNTIKRLLCALCCAALLLSITACTQQETVSGTPSAETPTPAPEATAAPEETPAPTPAPEESAGEEHKSVLPAPESGSDAFREAFIANPVDTQYASDLELAGSVAGIITACNTASTSWQAQIDSVYAQIIERGDTETVEKVKEAQSHWVNEQSSELQAIRESVSEDDPLAAITVAESIMLYYRTRAIDLCAALFEIDGQLVFG